MAGWQPNPGAQTAFLASTTREVLYGGAAAGGKTDALIANALRWAEHPKHRAIILRRTRPQLQEVIDRTWELYPDIVPGAKWNERENRWLFPSGAVIQMGFAEHEQDIRAFKSFEYNLVEFDELTSFTEAQYTFMFSRNRTKSADLPPMMRAATNPGDIGHQWVFERFIRGRTPYLVYDEYQQLDSKNRLAVPRQFIPAKVWDNYKLPNRDEYIAGLLQMGDEGLMYLHGVWTNLGGAMFRAPLKVVPHATSGEFFVVRAMDYGIYDPTCVLWLVVYPKRNQVEIVGEYYAREKSVDEVAQAIFDTEARLALPRPRYSVLDPSAWGRDPATLKSVATELQSKGLWFTKANNDRLAGWSQLMRLLYRGDLRVWEGEAPNLQRTLPMLQRDPKKPNDLRDHQEDHAADALRYGLMAVWEGVDAEPTPEPIPVDETKRDMIFDKVLAEINRSSTTPYIPELGEF